MIAASIEANNPKLKVLDPFMGSGSSALAAFQHGVSFFGCDISEESVDMSIQRLNSFLNSEPDPFQKNSAIPPDSKIWW